MPRMVAPSGNPLKTQMRATLRYNDTVTVNPGAAALLANVFNASSPFDPDETNFGHQSRGFDELMLLYQHGVVIRSRITCRYIPDDTNNPLIVGVSLRKAKTAIPDLIDAMEIKPVTSMILPSLLYYPLNLTASFDNLKYNSLKTIVGDPDYRFSTSSSPSNNAWYHVWVIDPSGSDPAGVQIDVTIEYECIFSNPNPLAES